MIIDSVQSLNTLQLSRDIKVVSFDIFDTVLIRRVDPPEKTKELSCDRALKDGVVDRSGAGLLSLRKTVEENLKSQATAHGKDREYSIHDVFFEVASYLKVKDIQATVSRLLDIELEIEKAVTLPMPGIKDQLRRLSQGYRLIAVSDTYLTTQMLKQVLDHLGLGDYFKAIYASSEYKLSKSSGSLFRLILEAENIGPHELQHIGDNFLSDYFVPKKIGVKTVCLNDNWNFSRKHTLHAVRQLSDESNFWSSCSELLNLLSVQRPSGSKDDLLHNFGYMFIGPLLTIFTHLLFLELTKKDIRNIYFIARDGFMLKKIFTLFADRLSDGGEVFNSHYLCASRYTAVLASVDSLTDREWRHTTRLASTVKDVLTRLGVTTAETDSLLNEYHLSQESRLTESSTLGSLRELFNDRRLSEMVLKKTRTMRDLLRLYLQQRGFMKSQKAALVDIGWR
ncbi:MAG TPA: HAD-IA family hydrolase, partial [Thermodesulfovibrionales bacterium]|nr:HAD-IA family hydrolase [Thermodesulfovibrionales bacterium]